MSVAKSKKRINGRKDTRVADSCAGNSRFGVLILEYLRIIGRILFVCVRSVGVVVLPKRAVTVFDCCGVALFKVAWMDSYYIKVYDDHEVAAAAEIYEMSSAAVVFAADQFVDFCRKNLNDVFVYAIIRRDHVALDRACACWLKSVSIRLNTSDEWRRRSVTNRQADYLREAFCVPDAEVAQMTMLDASYRIDYEKIKQLLSVIGNDA